MLVSLLLVACKKDDDAPFAVALPEVEPPLAAIDDPLAGTGVESCAYIGETRCVDGVAEVCRLYDPAAGAEVAAPPDTLVRVLEFERWHDRFHAPSGLTVDRVFAGPTAPGTPEDVWSTDSWFSDYDGLGDAALWTGVAAMSDALRYATTGTTADRERVDRRARALLSLFDATGLDGYLARYVYLDGPPETPRSPDWIIRRDAPGDHDHPVTAPTPDLSFPATIDGVAVAPMWHGQPSIDQYTGVIVGLTLADAVLGDPDLHDRLTTHVTCYLERLERIEIVNVQDSADTVAAVLALLGVDASELDLSERERIVAYALPQYNEKSASGFAATCAGRGPATTASRTVDVADSGALNDLVGLAEDLDPSQQPGRTTLDHVYAPDLRGADAVHLTRLGLTAWYLTGDDVWYTFVVDTLQAELGAVEVARTLGAVSVPDWCRSWYADHLAFVSLWGSLLLLDDSPLRTELLAVMEDEAWGQIALGLDNALFDVMVGGTLSSEAGAEAWARAEGVVRSLGGNGGIVRDPRRAYTEPYEDVWGALGEPATRCPTEQERATCEDGYEVFTLALPGVDITSPCIGVASECPVGDGCARKLTEAPVPAGRRPYTDVLWQRSPFELGFTTSVEGGEQAPGLDVTVPYRVARWHGLEADGAGLVLAWVPGDSACP